ncbi:hypothetical protein ACQCSX_04440 [Pseudarthrobacter sp. P1]|uniref:hypothetical protein n=1 Tax=Pseudarthrobacter sp. P1 TaxID=3418418 RepID=UPI003CF1A091
MLGHEGVIRALWGRVCADYPPMIAALSESLGLGPDGIPTPAVEDIHANDVDVVAIGHYPAVMIVQDGTGINQSTRQTGANGAYDEYRFRYRVKLMIYNTGTDYGPTELLRKRLLLALRMTLLSRKILHDDGSESAVVDSTYLRESFSELASDGTGQLLAGAYLEIEIATTERLTGHISQDPTELAPVVHPALG